MNHVAQFIHSFNIGGSEILAANLARGLSGKGFHSSVWAMTGEGCLADTLRREGVDIASFACPAGVSPTAICKLALRMQQKKVDAVVTHHFRQLFHAAPAALITGTSLIHVEHDYHFYEDSPQYLPALRRLLRFSSGFVVVSSELVKDFQQGLGSRVECIAIPNGVDTQLFRRRGAVREAMRREYGFDDKTFVIGSCSRLEPVKRVELLLAGFSLYAEHNPFARLVIVGVGSQHGFLLQESQRLGLTGKVTFAGSRNNVADFFNMFDLFTLTSRNEGLPLAVLEAMATELPVVSTNVGSVATVVGEDTGILLQHPTPEELCVAFTALQDPALRARLGEKGREIVQDRHSIGTMVQSYSETLLQDPHTPAAKYLQRLRTKS